MKNSIFIIVMALSIVFVGLSNNVHGQTDNDGTCGEQKDYLTANGYKPAGSYNVYINDDSKSTVTRVYFQPFESNDCELISNSPNKSQSLIGSITNTSEVYGKYLIFTDDIENSANTSIILRDSSLNCSEVELCTTEFESSTLKLVPKTISYRYDDASVKLYDKLENSKIKEVVYAVDGRPVYSSKKFEDFNMNYVSAGNHTVQRIVVFENGQKIISEEKLKNSFFGDPIPTFRSLFFVNSIVTRTIGILLFLVVLVFILLLVFSLIENRHKWRNNHIVSNKKVSKTKTGVYSESKWSETATTLSMFKRPLLILVIFIFITWVFMNNIATIITTDGNSMQSTLQDGQKFIINKVPLTLAKVNGNTYIPDRGEIIVFNSTSDSNEESSFIDESYVVKRVIGVPGDRVLLKEGKFTIYNNEFKDGYNPDSNSEWTNTYIPSTEINKKIDVLIGVGEIFVVGDNRDYSVDSRHYGPIDVNDIVGLMSRRL